MTTKERIGLSLSRVRNQPSRSMGKIHVYDGNGKGKSQAALGIVLRSIGLGIENTCNSRVMLVRLLKGPDRDFDEDRSIAVLQSGFPHLIDQVRSGRNLDFDLTSLDITANDLAEARRGWDAAKGAMMSGLYSVVVIDELNPALSLGLISLSDVIEAFKNRPAHVEVIATGRDCPSDLIRIADLHSEIVPSTSSSTVGFDIYTGNGKGKSASALGRALQGIGRSILDNDHQSGKVLILQFLKGSGHTEEPAIKAIQTAYPSLVEHLRCGTGELVSWNDRKAIDYSEADRGWQVAKAAIQSGNYKMIILDQLNCVVNLGLIQDIRDVHDTLVGKSESLQIIVTGRFAGPLNDPDAVPSYYSHATRVLNVTERQHYRTCNQDHTPRVGVDY